MNQQTLEERFDSLEKDYLELLSTAYSEFSSFANSMKNYVESAKYKIWVVRARRLIEESYGKDSDFHKEFIDGEKGFYSSNHDILTKQLKPIFDAAKIELPYALRSRSEPLISKDNSLGMIINILERFPAFCRQLNKRYNERNTIEVKDEYDVQDLVHALLRLHFDDVRSEEYTPTFAGAASRQDFMLKKEKIVIEVKKTRKSLGAGKIGEELLVDMARYRAHQDCDILICFVYDPECWVNNPKGVIADLESKDQEGKVRVVIAQF